MGNGFAKVRENRCLMVKIKGFTNFMFRFSFKNSPSSSKTYLVRIRVNRNSMLMILISNYTAFTYNAHRSVTSCGGNYNFLLEMRVLRLMEVLFDHR